jgi:hypothetical protein
MKTLLNLTLIGALAGLIGCGDAPTSQTGSSPSKPTGPQYLTTTEPVNPAPVGQARMDAEDGAAVTLIGHIGGSAEPFVNGLAAFTIVDPKVQYCPPEEGCPTPWDYCCTQDQVKDNIATIKVVDDQGRPVAEDARQLLGVRELSLVVVQGTARRDDQGNLSVLASSIYVKP